MQNNAIPDTTSPKDKSGSNEKEAQKFLNGAKKIISAIIEAGEKFGSVIQYPSMAAEAAEMAKWGRLTVGAQFLLVESVYEGGVKGDVSAGVNNLFGGALGMMATAKFGPKVGAAVNVVAKNALDWISDQTRKYGLGRKFYDFAHEDDLNANAEFRGLLSNFFPGARSKDVASNVRQVYDDSGVLTGYLALARDVKAGIHTATMLTPEGNIARQVIFNANSGVTTMRVSGITMVMDPQVGHATATLDWDQDKVPLRINERGEIQYFGVNFRLAGQPLDGMEISSGSNHYKVSPDATVAKQDGYVVVSNEKGDGLPNLVLNKSGGYTFDFDKETQNVVIHPWGNPSPRSPELIQGWLKKNGYDGWHSTMGEWRADKPEASDGHKLHGGDETQGEEIMPASKSDVGGEVNPQTEDVNPNPGYLNGAQLDKSESPENSNGHPALADAGHGAGSRRISVNPDCTGVETITHPDGSTTEMEFNALKGCVLLGREYCTSPEVVAHAPQRFALDYTARMMRELQQRAGRVQQGDMPDEGRDEAQQPEGEQNGIGDTGSNTAPERNSALASTASDPQQGEQPRQTDEMQPPSEPETLAGAQSDVTA